MDDGGGVDGAKRIASSGDVAEQVEDGGTMEGSAGAETLGAGSSGLTGAADDDAVQGRLG